MKLDENEEKMQVERRRIEAERRALTFRHEFLVRMGNWFGEYGLNEVRVRYKKSNFLMFNDPIQIQNFSNPFSEDSEKKNLLDVLIPDPKYAFLQKQIYNVNALLSISTLQYRIQRNIFKCISISGISFKTPILYGDDFYICVNNTENPRLFLTPMIPHYSNIIETNEKIPLALTPVPGKLCRFRILDPERERMNQLDGTPVRIMTRVCLLHVYSNMLLSVDINNTVDFGTHNHTYHNCNASNNFWKFIIPPIDKNIVKNEEDFIH